MPDRMLMFSGDGLGTGQYCSLNNFDSLGHIEAASALALAWPQWVVAHFPFHAARVDPMPAGANALFKNLVEDRFVPELFLLRGE